MWQIHCLAQMALDPMVGVYAETGGAHLDGSEISSFLKRMERLKAAPAARADADSRASSGDAQHLFLSSKQAAQDAGTRRAARGSGDQTLSDILKELKRLGQAPGSRGRLPQDGATPRNTRAASAATSDAGTTKGRAMGTPKRDVQVSGFCWSWNVLSHCGCCAREMFYPTQDANTTKYARRGYFSAHAPP